MQETWNTRHQQKGSPKGAPSSVVRTGRDCGMYGVCVQCGPCWADFIVKRCVFLWRIYAPSSVPQRPPCVENFGTPPRPTLPRLTSHDPPARARGA